MPCCHLYHCCFEQQYCDYHCNLHHQLQSHHFLLYLTIYSSYLQSLHQHHLKYLLPSSVKRQIIPPAPSGIIHNYSVFINYQTLYICICRPLHLPVLSRLLPPILYLWMPQHSQLILSTSLLQEQPLQWRLIICLLLRLVVYFSERFVTGCFHCWKFCTEFHPGS